ncbi:MAG: phosphoribosylformylglycinamidine cyclo-ligase [Chitinophagales bacterium]|nr:phosphoribosylformylglycinamidine cyclo-ligase [Chitinophagales bacterium]MBP9189396.1 phosphoribosylformylglycinamidine cyclo-ligase [Chitinophagales bacterium]MBP9705353.1 phosphoribosylformylglycinamidine cyclo-ligase [Chitinophagales bacterium]
MQENKYEKRGVSSQKEDVHKAIQMLDKGLFSNAFCKILPDIIGDDELYCNVMHADTAGTKTSLAYLYWKETGDISVWRGIAQDALVMNVDDMACVGITDNIIISSTIGRNKGLIPGEILAEIIGGTQDFIERMAASDIHLFHSGGETADVGDIVRTIDVGITAFGRIKRNELIVNDIKPGCVIVGLSSTGQSTYEDFYNGGTGSNGLTSARHDIFTNDYAAKYPESYDTNLPADVVYSGSRKLTDVIDEAGTTLGKLVLSPTRTYLPVLKDVIKNFKNQIQGIIHCSGGGQTKVLHFVNDIHIVKDNLFEMPLLFKIIQQESGSGLKEMYQVFNMGHRMELYVEPAIANDIIAISKSYNIDAKVIGYCKEQSSKKLTIHAGNELLEY